MLYEIYHSKIPVNFTNIISLTCSMYTGAGHKIKTWQRKLTIYEVIDLVLAVVFDY